MMTTRAYDYDVRRREAALMIVCRTNAKPCGHVGRLAVEGATKLFWKADWAAKWVAQGIDIEGGGKDTDHGGCSR